MPEYTSQSLLVKLLLFYGVHMPDHPGKWRVHYWLRKMFDVNLSGEFAVSRRGLKWILRPSDYVQESLFWLGEKDKWELYHLRHFAREGGAILDIGSNFGYYSLLLADYLAGKCMVYAFEPNPETYSRLVKNVEVNNMTSTILPQCLGLSDTGGRAVVRSFSANSGASYLEMDDLHGVVNLSSVDEFCREHGIRDIAIVKVDVEGFEERVLKGSSEMLKKFRPVLMIELNPHTLAQQGSSVERVVDKLAGYDYSLWVPDRKKLVSFDVSKFEGAEYVNVFCISSNER